jgi:soluble lytic murein transglycosylase-like protein
MTPRRSRSLRLAPLATLLVWLVPGSADADIYSYTDEEGVVHFVNKPTGDARYQLYIKAPATKKTGAIAPGVTPVPPSDKSLERFTRYDQWIVQAATLYQIPVELIRAVMKVESDYDARAVSRTGAQGLMQLMPETGLRMQVRDAFDPRENIFGGTRYLRVLANTFNGDLELTIAAYNAGEGAVSRYGGIPPYEETQQYVVKVKQYYRRYRLSSDAVLASEAL